jgi:hypothetical protein
VLVVAAENDFTPLAEKIELAHQLRGNIVVVKGSRHGTPFDSIKITNACLRAFLKDESLPKEPSWLCDSETHVKTLTLAGSIAEEHALSALLTE